MTRKMIDFAGKDLINKNTDNDMFSWHVNYCILDRLKLIVFTHDLSAMALVFYGLKKSEFKNPKNILINALRHTLKNAEIPLELINKYIQDADDKPITYGKTKGKVLVSRLTSILLDTEYLAYEIGVNEFIEQYELARKINQFIRTENKGKEGFIPKDRMKELLEEMYN